MAQYGTDTGVIRAGNAIGNAARGNKVRVLIGPLVALAAARGKLLPWAPVFLSFGIGFYFALKVEPGLELLGTAAVLLAVGTGIGLWGPELFRVPAIGLALMAAGLLLASARAQTVAAPVLSFRYYGPVEGRIIGIDRSFSDQLRITLDRVVLSDVSPARTPTRVRVALHGDQGFVDLQPGLTVILSAHLSPPEGPVEPGGFDFQRLAWFSELGAVGYTRSPVLALASPDDGVALLAFRLRRTISTAIQARIDGQAGAFAAALMTGDRSGTTQETTNALRGSNLSHLIAISGLHMGLLTGFVFATCRYGLALVPPLALRFNTKKLAAVLALAAAMFYMMLAGPSVATRRAFIMAAVMLVAVLLDRRAISLRSVAIAALIVLMLEPESLVEPGFQMSFGATVALITAFKQWTRVQAYIPALLRPLAMLILSSAAAGFATAPIAAAQFNRIAEYGLLANLLAGPLMGLLVMPMGVIAAILAPLGLADPALWLMGQGTGFILWVAAWVSGLQGAVIAVPSPPWAVLPLIGLGGMLALVPRRGDLRAVGGIVLVAAFALWSTTARPDLLIASDGGIVGILGPEGRALSKAKGAGFVASSWLLDDGDLADQAAAFDRPGFEGKTGAMRAELDGRPFWHFTGKAAPERAAAACEEGGIVILNGEWQGPPPTLCEVFDVIRLRQTGAVAIFAGTDGLRVITARESAGARLWNSRSSRRRVAQ